MHAISKGFQIDKRQTHAAQCPQQRLPSATSVARHPTGRNLRSCLNEGLHLYLPNDRVRQSFDEQLSMHDSPCDTHVQLT